jgi:hypothetical protein
MKRNILVNVCLAILMLGFTGCLTVEFKEYTFRLNPDGTGSGTIKFVNLLSQDEDDADVSAADYTELVDNWLHGTGFEGENPGLVITGKRLFEENGQLCGEITFTFTSLQDASFLLFSDCECTPYLYFLDTSTESYIESNGTYLGEENASMSFIRFEKGMEELSFKTIVQSDLSTCRSLLSYYK